MNRFRDKYGPLVTKNALKEIIAEYFPNDSRFEFDLIQQGRENINILVTIRRKKYVLRIYNDKQYGRESRKTQKFFDSLPTFFISLFDLPLLRYLQGIRVDKS